MLRSTLQPTRTRIAALLGAPVVGVFLLAPSAFADTPPPGKKVDSATVIDRACKHANEDSEDAANGTCEKLVAPLLSHAIGPGSGLTCREISATDIECRPER
ncbi:hypothetical protein [Streptomyces sp. NPDC001137]|uniref:hypothetical protein n=1 Tax=Streptomyces sp. NPDC001137 TaxID=3154378 RepID=UPI00332472C4